jgi:hypothetical protein
MEEELLKAQRDGAASRSAKLYRLKKKAGTPEPLREKLYAAEVAERELSDAYSSLLGLPALRK